jgi:hypothetical protein
MGTTSHIMTSFVELISQTADKFEHIIQTHCDNLKLIPTEDFGWQNTRWSSSQFRMAHVERFTQPKFSVLHMVIFPHVMDPSPIFGFDIIASDTKATGVFFDRSPTLECWGPITNKTFTQERVRPEWGTIFSDHWIACKPTYTEAEEICALACDTLADYLVRLIQTHSAHLHDIIQAQNNYSLKQRENIHTTTVIRKLLGEERGTHFINEILFPVIK